MANNPFDRQVINERERPLSSDINYLQSYVYRSLMTLLDLPNRRRTSTGTTKGFSESGFLADGLMVLPGTGMQVVVNPGVGIKVHDVEEVAVGSVVGLDDRGSVQPFLLMSDATFNVPAADPTNPRIDIVEVDVARVLSNPLSRDVFSPNLAAFVAGLQNKTLSYALDGLTSVNGSQPLNYKTGTPLGSPVAPAVSPGYVQLGQVNIAAAQSSILREHIADKRIIRVPGGVIQGGGGVTLGTAGQASTMGVVTAPGVEVSASCAGFTSGGYIWVWAGAAQGPAHMTVATSDNVGGGLWFPAACVSVANGLADAAEVAAANAGSQARTVKMAVGQAYYKFLISTRTWDGAAIVPTAANVRCMFNFGMRNT